MNPLGMSEEKITEGLHAAQKKRFDAVALARAHCDWDELERLELTNRWYFMEAIRFAESHHSQALRELVEIVGEIANHPCYTMTDCGECVHCRASNALAALNSPTPTSKEEE